MNSEARCRLSILSTAVAGVLAAGAGAGAGAQDTDAADEPSRVQIARPTLEAPPMVVEEIIAVGRLRSSAMDVVQERLELDVVSDYLGTDQISRTGDSTVSLALRRMPGLTLVNDQFIYVRGLGERYSSTLLNHAYVPSPDLTRNVLPLDIFPAEIIEALAVQKAYSPDMPAAFGGGNVNILTRGIPDRPVASVEITSGYNTTSNRDGITYRGGSDDSFGSDDGTRALPGPIANAIQDYQGDISTMGILDGLNRDGAAHALSEAQAINRQLATSLYRDIDFQSKSLGPDLGVEASAGNRWYVGDAEQWRVGALGLLSYGNNWRNRERTIRKVINPSEEYHVEQRTTNQVSATAVLNVGVGYGDDHEISTSSLFLRNTEDEAALAVGHTYNAQLVSGRGIRDYSIRFEERELVSNQIRGRHVIGSETMETLAFLDRPALAGVTYEWYYSDSEARTDVPSEIAISGEDRYDPVTGEFLSTAIRRTSSAANYRYTELTDEVESFGWDLMKPFMAGDLDIELSGGQDISRKARDYRQTELTLGTTAAAAVPALAGTPGGVLTDENILDAANRFALGIGGLGTESYLAGQTVDASYMKVDARLRETWRFSGGVRWEQFTQVSMPIDPLNFDVDRGQSVIPHDELANLVFKEDELYPAFSVTYMRPRFWAETFQLRFGVSETVARPDLREVSDSTYIDPRTEWRVRGRPGLLPSPIRNYDVRAEWFFDSGDNFTVSLFHKDIERPLETVEVPGSDKNFAMTFVNAQGADVSGIEVEWFKSLSSLSRRWGRWIDPFFVAGNVTLSDSELVVGNLGLDLTKATRPMTGHSDTILNLQVGFDSPNGAHSGSLVYNTSSDRVFFAGRSGAADTYEQPFDSLDLIYSFHPTDRVSVKARVQNLLDERLVLEQAGVRILEQDIGRTFKVDLKWDVGQ